VSRWRDIVTRISTVRGVLGVIGLVRLERASSRTLSWQVESPAVVHEHDEVSESPFGGLGQMTHPRRAPPQYDCNAPAKRSRQAVLGS